MFNKIKKILKKTKYLLIMVLVIIVIILIKNKVLILGKINTDNEKQGLENLQFEYEIKNTDGKTAQVLININSNEGINNIKFLNKEGNEINLECNNKKMSE